MGKINMNISIDFDDAIFNDPASDADNIDVIIERMRDYLQSDSFMAGDIAAELIRQLGGYATWVDATIEAE